MLNKIIAKTEQTEEGQEGFVPEQERPVEH